MVDIIAILDRSGSMTSMAQEVIGAFNSFLADQKAQPGDAQLTLVLFDDKYEVVHNQVPIQDVPDLDGTVYFTRGMTALNDAVGKAIKSVGPVANAIVLIQTDGYENASQEYTSEQVKELVDTKQTIGWEFTFIGAGIDAFAAGSQLGLDAGSTFTVAATADGYASMGSTIALSASSYRKRVADKDA